MWTKETVSVKQYLFICSQQSVFWRLYTLVELVQKSRWLSGEYTSCGDFLRGTEVCDWLSEGKAEGASFWTNVSLITWTCAPEEQAHLRHSGRTQMSSHANHGLCVQCCWCCFWWVQVWIMCAVLPVSFLMSGEVTVTAAMTCQGNCDPRDDDMSR